MTQTLAPIPAPPKHPEYGHLHYLAGDAPVLNFFGLARQIPEGIFRLDFPGRTLIQAYDPDLVAELTDERRFQKRIHPSYTNVRNLGGDGLFTSDSSEPNWGKAHRILLPAFSQRAMKGYFGQMLEVAQNLVGKWERTQGQDVRVADDMTRLTLDTISLSGFDYRFRSFDKEELHPFLQALARVMHHTMTMASRPPILTPEMEEADRAYWADIAAMNELVDEVIRERREHGGGGDDLLGLMLNATDPETGGRLSDENIRYQVMTFLIAGHETTSGLLAFTLYLLLRHPHVLAQAYAEVDRLLPGNAVPTYDTVMKLDVIPRILDEALRFWSTIPNYAVTALRDEVIGGKYEIKAGQQVALLIPALHRHPGAWANPDEFDIDRWTPQNRRTHHPAAYKPFGNGMRACIGRQFALTEAKLALLLVLQKFALVDPYDYHLKVKQSLTIKPEDFVLRVRERRPHERFSAPVPVAEEPQPDLSRVSVAGTGVALTVAYGSNLGTTEDLASRVADYATRAGFQTRLTTLDDLVNNVPGEGLLFVTTATYNGAAPDNAARFDAWVQEGGLAEGSLEGLRFALLGTGNTQWVTYQAFPKRVEAALLRAGAQPFVPRGEADANGDFDGMVNAWFQTLLRKVSGEFGTPAQEENGPRYDLDLLTEADVRPAVVSEKAYGLEVIASEELVGDPAGLWDFSQEPPRPSTKAITFELPEGITYETGDHIAVFAKNEPRLVEWAAGKLRLKPGQVVRLRQSGHRKSHLPLNTPVTVEVLLSEFVELQDVATRSNIEVLLAHTPCPWTTRQLKAYLEDDARYEAEVRRPNLSVLGLLNRFPAVELPLPVFLELCPPIRPRYYSISSSPLVAPRTPSLTVGLLEAPSWAGAGQFRGLASAYLNRVQPGDTVFGYVRKPNPPFRPPVDPRTPMILVGPGTGIAPLRGFVEERAAQRAAGQTVGLSKVFYGCRHPEHDFFYKGDFGRWQREGVAEIHAAYSAVTGHPYRFVQDAIAGDQESVWALIEAGAHIYVCGDGVRMAPAVRQTFARLYREKTGAPAGEAEAWVDQLMREGRYQQDVFGASK
ncbi:putative bifunctional P-450/NADPH-P450 reductase1, cypD [Deinococcus aerius]|uniref:Bifunctional cytochrome P450/NADPH--P450 reductase n=1 Tax=Deinococcus aerius TaxID=200253 RepID=A0A2I9DQ46_9DEIO|nr:cytochrome P450 [Deinococcus aerius]GBF07341.1 putative bifunctional P-450/NADPH-P450 reductase1, cypD [Deinococcus aerius]